MIKSVGSRILVAVLAGAVGFLLMSQLRAHSGVTQRLEAESEEDLTRIFSRLNAESAALHDEVTDLQVELQALDTSAQRDELARQTAARQLDDLQILAGTVAAHGPGVVVKVDDPAGKFTFDLLIDLIQELRDAGAEALAVGDRRIGTATWFGAAHGGVSVDGHVVSSPYRIVAIGDPATLEGGLNIPGGAVDSLSALDRVEVGVVRESDVVVPALDRTPSFRVARPVE